jgi:hypothetical protein
MWLRDILPAVGGFKLFAQGKSSDLKAHYDIDPYCDGA